MKYFIITLALFPVLFATTINIPEDYATIQEGIDASIQGDTVLVAQGTYYENLILEKNIVLASHALLDDLGPDWLNNENITGTIINGGQEPSDPSKGSCLIIRHNFMNIQPVIIGLTFQDGTGTDMTISNCGVTKVDRSGGGILMYKSYPTINYNRFIDNGHSSDDERAGKGVRNGGAMGHYSDEGVEFDEDRSSNTDSGSWDGGTRESYYLDYADLETVGNMIKPKKIMNSKLVKDQNSSIKSSDEPPSRDLDLVPGEGSRGTLNIYLYDSYGDGWNGNVLTIGEGNTFTLTDGSYSSSVLNIDDGEYPVICGGGDWQYEVSWEIVDAASGNLLLSGGAPFEGGILVGGEIPDPPELLDISNNYFDGNASGNGENFYSHGYEGIVDVSNSIFEDIDCEENEVNDFVLQSIENEAEYLQDDISGSCIDSDAYFVSSAGDDNNIGTESQPFKTIGHALTLVKEGEENTTTIHIGDGTYSPSLNS